MMDDDGHAWLDEHQDRAQKLIYLFYVLAVLSLVAIIVPIRWPKSSMLLAIAVVLLGATALASGCYIANAGGKIRHREFRNEPAPPIRSQGNKSIERLSRRSIEGLNRKPHCHSERSEESLIHSASMLRPFGDDNRA
jgi:hypothetical protein